MTGKFILSAEVEKDKNDWGISAWFSRPTTTGAKHLVVIEAEFLPGCSHNFHRHPGQEEVIYVLEGEIEQWLDQSSKILRQGDTVFIGEGVVHASFNDADKPAKILAILGPCKGEDGYGLEDMSGEEPWASLRG